jgi:hypothetical protein
VALITSSRASAANISVTNLVSILGVAGRHIVTGGGTRLNPSQSWHVPVPTHAPTTGYGRTPPYIRKYSLFPFVGLSVIRVYWPNLYTLILSFFSFYLYIHKKRFEDV